MYKLSVEPTHVQETLSEHILADGYDLVYDIEKSHGVFLYDSLHDRELLDFFTCFASVPLGYNHPAMLTDEVFKRNLLLAALSNPSNSDIYTTQYAQFVKTFAEVGIPDYLPHAFFISGGTLAIENALKAAMDWKVQKNFEKGYATERGHQVLHFEQAFHGRSGYTMSLTNTLPEKTKWYARFDWPRVSVPSLCFPDDDAATADCQAQEEKSIRQIKQAFAERKDDICAIIIEPVQAEGGDNHIRREFAEQLRILADENECLLIYDEIQTGVGLTGKFWCHEHFGEHARPDIIAFGKKMQVCGILAGKKLDEVDDNVFTAHSRISSTWGGNLADMVRATKILEIIRDDKLVENAAATGAYLQRRLRELQASGKPLANVRGKGMLTAFDFPNHATRNNFLKKALTHNALFLGCGDRTIRFRPALILEERHVDLGIELLEKII